jgi:MFS family permease
MTGVWRAPYRWVSIGSVALVFLAAVETLAVTTVMPVIVADLDGRSLYAVAFAGTLATSVIGMVASGAWSDRAGPAAPLTAAVSVFVAGLVVAGVAPGMLVLVAGRLLQGFGTGGITVALYVVVGRFYPPELHGRILAGFAAAWVLPALVGPFLAGAVAELLHWRWVFLGVAALSAAAYTLLLPRLSQPELRGSQASTTAPLLRPLAWAVAVSVGVIGSSIAGETGSLSPALVGAGLILVVVAIRPLLPRRTLTAARGLPSVILLRALIASAFFSAEIYVPYVFMEEYGFSPLWAGLALTGSALAWSGASELQGRVGDRWGTRRVMAIGLTLLVASLASVGVAVALHAPAALVIVAWTVGGAGIGLIYPRITVLMLAASTRDDQGANSAALSIAEAAATATAIAIAGLIVAGIGGGMAGFVAAFAFGLALALIAVVPGTRVERASPVAR